MPLSLHVGSSRDASTRVVMDGGSSGWVNRTAIRFVHLIHEVQKSLTSFILGGVLERFPRLKIVSAESDIGWLAHYVQRLDHAYEKFGGMVEHPLPMKPSEYVRRQVWATFQDDPIGAAPFRRSMRWPRTETASCSPFPRSVDTICLGGSFGSRS